ncbi:MAG: HepT-like ribonuclease domain-containing protein [Planctomycetota bacterium]
MAGMQDILVHAYDAVDLTEVWRAANEEVPALISLMEPLVPPSAAGPQPKNDSQSWSQGAAPPRAVSCQPSAFSQKTSPQDAEKSRRKTLSGKYIPCGPVMPFVFTMPRRHESLQARSWSIRLVLFLR